MAVDRGHHLSVPMCTGTIPGHIFVSHGDVFLVPGNVFIESGHLCLDLGYNRIVPGPTPSTQVCPKTIPGRPHVAEMCPWSGPGCPRFKDLPSVWNYRQQILTSRSTPEFCFSQADQVRVLNKFRVHRSFSDFV